MHKTTNTLRLIKQSLASSDEDASASYISRGHSAQMERESGSAAYWKMIDEAILRARRKEML